MPSKKTLKIKTPNRFELEGLKAVGNEIIKELSDRDAYYNLIFSEDQYFLSSNCYCFNWDYCYNLISFGILTNNILQLTFEYVKDRNIDIEEEGETVRFLVNFERFYDSEPNEYLKKRLS
jgi:hypothetical protein